MSTAELKKLVKTEYKYQNTYRIIIWWEFRRVLYNLTILPLFLIEKELISWLESSTQAENKDLITLTLYVWVACNIVFTVAWMIETLIKRSEKIASKIFAIGFLFTLFSILVPLILKVIFWISSGFNFF